MEGDAMLLGVPKDMRLTRARETFLIDCKAAGLPEMALREYRDILNALIAFTGNMLVRELGPDHVRFFIAELSDRGLLSEQALMKRYAVIRSWIRWMYAQKVITERTSASAKPPHPSSHSSMLTDEEVVPYHYNGRATRVYLYLQDEDLLEALRAELSHQKGYRRPQ
jgi:site-specific recombinase XerC